MGRTPASRTGAGGAKYPEVTLTGSLRGADFLGEVKLSSTAGLSSRGRLLPVVLVEVFILEELVSKIKRR